MDHRGTTALITGASSGLGEQFAADLAARGADLVLVARRADRLEALAERLRAAHGVEAVPLAVDLARPGAAADLVAGLAEREIAVTTLVNCAGFAVTAPFTETTPRAAADQVAVNVASLVDLTHALLPALTASGRGALVNVASLVGHQPAPGMAVYGATKAFVLSFTEALAVELRGSGVRVLCLSPGSTSTEFYAVSGTSTDGARFQTPEEVVATALHALDRRRTPASVVSGRGNRLVAATSRVLPRRVVLSLAAGSVRRAA